MNKGVEIVLARMDSHPEEFYGDSEKWRFVYKDYFRDAMTEVEKGAIFDKLKQLRRQEFDEHVMQALVPVEEEKEEFRGYKRMPLYTNAHQNQVDHMKAHLDALKQDFTTTTIKNK